MNTLVPGERHPALEVAEQERADYLAVVASMAFADAQADESELARVREMCKALELSEAATDRVMAAAGSPDDAGVEEILARLTDSDLKYALLVDAIDIAYADDRIVPEEAAEIETLAEKLEIDAHQVSLLRRYVEARTDRDTSDPEATNRAVAALASAGIPAAGLAVAATLGAPLVAAGGIAAALGIGSYMSVRWLLGRRKR